MAIAPGQREMTTAQKGNFARFAKSIFNKAKHVVGRDEVEELERIPMSTSTDFPGDEVQALCKFQEGEVIYTVAFLARRAEVTG